MRAPTVALLLLVVPAVSLLGPIGQIRPASADEPAPVPEAPAGAAAADATDAAKPVTPPALIPPSLVAPTTPDDEPNPPELAVLPTTRHGYRWQIAVTDGVAIGLSFIVDVSADGGDRPGGLATLTIASYFFAAPLVHGVHRQGRRALGSFALRAGLPLLFGLVGEKLDGTEPCNTCEDTLRSDGKIVGITLGALAAMALDTGLLARPYDKRTEAKPRTAWTPTLTGVRGGATAGVFGTF